jgi:replication initiator protein RepSA
MLGFGGHFLTKSRTALKFKVLRDNRVIWRRCQTSGPVVEDQGDEQPTTLVANFLQFVGAGWHTTGDALRAATAADMARRRREAARDAATHAIAM